MKRRNFIFGLFAIPAVAKALAKMPNSFAVSDYNPFKVHRTTDPFPATIVGKYENQMTYPNAFDMNLPCDCNADCPPEYICKQNGNSGRGIVTKDYNAGVWTPTGPLK